MSQQKRREMRVVLNLARTPSDGARPLLAAQQKREQVMRCETDPGETSAILSLSARIAWCSFDSAQKRWYGTKKEPNALSGGSKLLCYLGKETHVVFVGVDLLKGR